MKLLFIYSILLLFVCRVILVKSKPWKSQSGSSEESKCTSKVVSMVPVHRDFDIDEFLGTWYTVTRTTWAWGQKTFESTSMVIARNADDSLSYSLTGQLKGRCTAVEAGVLEPGDRLGEFTMKGPLPHNPHMVISFTDYKHVALVYICFKFRGGGKNAVCRRDGAQVEVWTSQPDSPDSRQVGAYVKRAGKRLGVCAEDMQDTTPGLCRVPDIMEAARKETIKGDSSDTDSAPSSICVVDNIQVQQGVDLSKLNGVWYEIARTRYTFNKLESVVSNLFYDEESERVHSFYTGTMATNTQQADQCVTPLKGTSRTKMPEDNPADRLGKIGDDESVYPWAPMKIMYLDDNYMMCYACYSGQTDEPCEQQGTEISISGRSRDLDEQSRDAMFALLAGVCIDPNDVLETNFEANCSSHVAGVSPKRKKAPSECVLEDIEGQGDYDKTELQGQWRLFASLHYGSSAALSGVVMTTSVNMEEPVEPAETTMIALTGHTEDGEQICESYTLRQRERCLDEPERITTVPHLDGTNFVFSKVLHLSDSLLVEYICTKQTSDGRCEEDGILFNVYRKFNDTENDVMDDDTEYNKAIELITKLAKSACLDPDLLEFETEWCDAAQLPETETPETLDYCDVDNLSIYSDLEEFSQEDLYGYWHLVARSENARDLGSNLDSLVVYFTSDGNDTLTIYYTGAQADTGVAAEVSTVHMLARCGQESNGDYLIRYSTSPDLVLYAPFKVFYLVADQVMVTYTCQHVLSDGRCEENEAVVRVWGRNSSLDNDTRITAMDNVDMLHWSCADLVQDGFIQDMALVANDNSSAVLEEYIRELQIDLTSPENSSSEEGDSEQTQQDETPDDFDDLEFELLMDDDEFYGTDD